MHRANKKVLAVDEGAFIEDWRHAERDAKSMVGAET
jgi:hypothetical protein